MGHRGKATRKCISKYRFGLIRSGLIFHNLLILQAFGLLWEKKNDYEKGCTRGAKIITAEIGCCYLIQYPVG